MEMIVLVGGMSLLTAGCILSYCFKTTGIFAATAMIALGGSLLYISFASTDILANKRSWSVLLIASGLLYGVLFFILRIRKAILERKRRRMEIKRRLCYTLPDRENSYVRTRLNTALNTVNTDMPPLKETEKPIDLGYALRLLSALKGAKLSQAERLQLVEAEYTFALYTGKERWSVEDVRAVNELCASVLKMAAKYAV